MESVSHEEKLDEAWVDDAPSTSKVLSSCAPSQMELFIFFIMVVTGRKYFFIFIFLTGQSSN
jgi:hypothetical protein